MRVLHLLTALAAVVIADDFAAPDSKSHPLRLWSSAVGKYWNDSFPIGNGRLGGMVKSDPTSDLIYINEDTFWSGGPLSRINQNARESVSRVQQLLLQGDTAQATLEANLGMSGTPSSMREYMPGGDFQIIFQNQTGSPKNYERWLDLEEGVAGLYYTRGDVTYKREYLASSPAGVMAIRLTASQPGSLSFYVKFQRPANQQNRFAEEAYSEDGDTIVTKIKEGELEAFFLAKVHTVGGSKRQIGDQIQVVNADEAWIYADMETSFSHDDPKSEAKKKLEGAVSSTYSKIREDHVKDHQGLFDRSSISLGESSAAQKALETGARRQALANAYDPEFLTLYYQFGRYLLISSSRSGTMAANLQGIWNNARDPAWGSKYTININIEMNYWPAEVTNLEELTEPFFALTDKIYESGKTTAEKMYGARGWCAHHNTDLWGDTAPQDVYAASAYWPLAGAWMLQHVYDHYLFTGDKEFLEKHYDQIKDAVLFFEDFLSDYKGWKTTNPSISPEATYKKDGSDYALTIGATIDNSIAWEIFTNFIEISKILGNKDEDLVKKATELRSQLPPLQVSPTTGAIMEWIEDYTESDAGHRHFSHLYGLFPGREITQSNKTLWTAAETTVKRRLDNEGGDTGWSRAWSAALHSRLLNGQGLEDDLQHLLVALTYDSLLDTGPPSGWQIDGNLGGTAAIAEGLLQSHNGVVVVLPALMPSSKAGSFKGLVARGGFVVDAEWENGNVKSIEVESRLGNPLRLRVGTGQSLPRGARVSSGSNSTDVIEQETKAGETYSFKFDA
ncbi:unnamed protein product [Clonostachys solani]|uniref:Glycosyl hydrolase family 95 N-terminal domain-containing protein n=1 Tax=Clonostachys solani TaxID=160281 RepID=A0A9N9Z093_9HYPO|nr:unnamed protein product [Clonostachys solani]